SRLGPASDARQISRYPRPRFLLRQLAFPPRRRRSGLPRYARDALAGQAVADAAVLGLGPHRLRPQHRARLHDRDDAHRLLRADLLYDARADRLSDLRRFRARELPSRLQRVLFLDHDLYDLG